MAKRSENSVGNGGEYIQKASYIRFYKFFLLTTDVAAVTFQDTYVLNEHENDFNDDGEKDIDSHMLETVKLQEIGLCYFCDCFGVCSRRTFNSCGKNQLCSVIATPPERTTDNEKQEPRRVYVLLFSDTRGKRDTAPTLSNIVFTPITFRHTKRLRIMQRFTLKTINLFS
ncbi:hypothetical protein EVAR_3788_1 [Eumeta japonica]|uniref:Uncharacterized protein n=1 Tax=Eumeta variegata TaxID=151549 RepID=A0A4C1SUK4_EUMVA|nr:hypothetical protein EVAR_3788_1 [Eumeta japonica]